MKEEKTSKTTFLRTFGVFLGILLMLVVVAPNVHASADVYDKTTGLTCDNKGGINGYNGTKADLVIPEKIGKVTVKSIWGTTFVGNKKIKSVTIPSTITSLDDYAFQECSALTTVKLPKTLKRIGVSAFLDCTSLKNVNLPDGLKVIDAEAFSNCKSLTEVNLPKNITFLGEGAFGGTSISSFTLPSYLDNIPPGILWNTQIKTFVVPPKIKYIQMDAFSECSKLTSLTIPKNVTAIDEKAFDQCPLLTVYGENGSYAQLYCMRYGIRFVDIAVGEKPTKPVVLADPIVIPASTPSSTVKATPSKTKLSYKNAVQKIEAYTINGEDYYRPTDLHCILGDSIKGFNPGYDTLHNLYQIGYGISDETGAPDKPVFSKNYGKIAPATRVYPDIFKATCEISYAIRVYSINGEYFFNFEDTMDVINCGALKNKKTGVVTLDPRYSYEPFDSPVFAPVPKGNAMYRKLQKALYDAYLNRKSESPVNDFTVPDNTTFYVPRGVTYDHLGCSKIKLGNNSSFIVKGRWDPEYPDRCLFPTKKTTKNAMLSNGFNFSKPVPESHADNYVVYTTGKNNFQWGTMGLTSASLSYGNVSDGVQSILLNYTRDKRDPQECVYVYINVAGGDSYGRLYNNARYSIDLTSQLAMVVGKNIGKKAVINKIMVQDSNGEGYGAAITLPVNWTITTSGPAPEGLKTVRYLPDQTGELYWGNHLEVNGLTKNSYLVKYLLNADTAYSVISTNNKYSCGRLGAYDETDTRIMGSSANIALFTGKKTAGGKNDYSFFVSPLSNDLHFVIDDIDYPTHGSLTIENKKTYLAFGLNNFPIGKDEHYSNSAYIMVKYHKKGDPEDFLNVLCCDNDVQVDQKQIGKLELTQALTELTNSKGATPIDSLYVYTYNDRDNDDFKYPSEKFVVVPCDFTSTAMESAKLGQNIVARIPAPTEAVELPKANAVIKGQLSIKNTSSFFSFDQLKISPAGKNKWSKNLLDRVTSMNESEVIDFSYTKEAPKFDIEVADVDGKFVVCRNVDYTGITSQYGATIGITVDDDNKVTATVHNDLPLKPIKPGDFGTDTIDVTLIAGSTTSTFDAKDFSIVYDDGRLTPFPNTVVKIIGLSQSTPGNAKLTLARYFDPNNEDKTQDYKPILLYKGYRVGLIEITNF